jgi:hypothetical protein
MAHIHAGHLTLVQSYIWFPLQLTFFRQTILRSDFRWAIATGLNLGIQLLGGIPQTAFYSILGILASVPIQPPYAATATLLGIICVT